VTVELEGFVAWLRAQGTPEPHVEVYRRGAEELAKYRDVESAVRAEESAGASPRRIANLRMVGDQLAAFEASQPAPVELDIAPLPRARAPAPATQQPFQPAVRSGPGFTPRRDVLPPRQGCTCRERHDIYVDNDFGVLAKLLGGGLGIATFVLIRLLGLLGALALALGLAGMGGLATTFSICFRCEGCRQPVRDLDDDERSDLRRGRALVFGVTLALLGGAAICAFLWWKLANAEV
jgi:hypothetical protein